ncbi:hypothetical protein [Candidatus Tisiphia endosymbiont of Nedyus quadrimaculatus]|uniref:hypothetical protein n=1 Tax=Candidatus Tisiphia endosymbiont of Nedyus quadrimaculatus TaxID=3139332 RepID=UPI00345EF9DC
MNNQQAIILLYSSHARFELIRQSLINFCKENNFTIIKIIDTPNKYDDRILRELIYTVSKQNNYNSPINLIIDDSIFGNICYFVTWVVITTLLEAKLINRLYIQENILHTANTEKDKFDNFLASNIITEHYLLKYCFSYFNVIMHAAKATDDEELHKVGNA